LSRRTLAALTILASLLSSTSLFAQTADDLVAKNLEARGGADKLAAIHSYVTKGTMRLPGDFKLKYEEKRARLDPAKDVCAVRVNAEIQGLTVIQAYDGTAGWRVNPFEGRKDAEKMGVDDARQMADEALIDGALLASRARGSKVEYLGTEDVDGTDAYKLRVSQPDGTIFTYYLDPDAYLEIRVDEQRTIRGAMQETVTDYSDYEKVAGVYFPFSIASSPPNVADKQVITINSADANVDVSPDTFAMPASPAKS
jgi:hypothetical protein